MSNSLRPHGLYSPWNSPGQNSRVGGLSLLQGIFPTQGSNPGLPHCRQILYQLSHKGSPRVEVNWPFRTKGTKTQQAALPELPRDDKQLPKCRETHARQVIPLLQGGAGIERPLLQVVVSQHQARNRAQKLPSAFSTFPFLSLLVAG